jgi:release factor glutamine methyltransferase
VREGLRNEPRLEELDARLGGLAERERLLELARKLGLSGALDRAMTRQAGAGLRDGSRGRMAESAARFVRRRVRPRLLGDLMAADLSGRAPVRCRFAGVEVRAAGGMFVPRLESEGLVRAARIRLEGVASPVAVEIGTGCGAAALALAGVLPAAGVHAVELDAPALRIARRNRRRLRLGNVRLYRGSLTDPLPPSLRGRVDVVFANLPCITDATWDASLAAAADLAYRGSGPDGLDLHRRLASDARALLRAGGALILQVSPDQWAVLRSQLGTLGYTRVEVAERQGPVVIGAAVLGEAAPA